MKQQGDGLQKAYIVTMEWGWIMGSDNKESWREEAISHGTCNADEPGYYSVHKEPLKRFKQGSNTIRFAILLMIYYFYSFWSKN